jgi:hypothetical protein
MTARAARQAAVEALFRAGAACPQRPDYATFAAYAQAFDAYQADTMAPLRAQLAAAADRLQETRP